MRGQYAIIKVGQLPYKFTKFHDTLEEAKDEAKRLCEIGNVRFLVLKVVGFADHAPNPVVWESLEDKV